MGINHFCQNCGARLEENAKFCAGCGQKVNDVPANVQIPQQEAAPLLVDEQQAIEVSSIPSEKSKGPRNLLETIKIEFYTHEGRLNRLAYFYRGIILSVAAFVVVGILGGLMAVAGGVLSFLFGILCFISYVFVAVASFMLIIRRCHDMNKSGWLSLTCLIPYINIVAGLYILFAGGTKGDNQYGPDPLQGKY